MTSAMRLASARPSNELTVSSLPSSPRNGSGLVMSRRTAFVLVSVAVLGVGCPRGAGQDFEAFPSLTTNDRAAEADLRLAREADLAGQADLAAERYRAFLRDHDEDPLVPVAHLGLGRVLLANGEVQPALVEFGFAASTDDPAVALAGRFYQGVAMHLAGRHEEAIERLSALAGQTTDPTRTVLLLRTLAAAARTTGRIVLALESLDRLVRSEELPSADREEGRRQIHELALGADAAAVQRAYVELSRDGVAWPEVAARAMRLSFDQGDVSRVAAIVAELRAHGVPLSDELGELSVRAERTARADPRVIGAIVPLTGRARQIGQQISRGLMLASGSRNVGPPSSDAPQLVLRDDGGDPARAAQAVEDLVSEHRAIAIIGPLEGQAARLAAQRAQELGVPLIALVSDPSVTDPGAMVFRLVPSPRDEALALVRAATARGATRFAILRPDSGYGRAMQEAFAAAVREAGGEVVVEARYEAAATSFGTVISTLAAVSFDALFVPDTGRQLNLVAPALAAAGLWSTRAGQSAPRGGRAITLLAPSVAIDARILQSSRYFQGALFASWFHAPTATGSGRAFADSYQQRFSEEPQPFAAYAYDAFGLVRRGVEAGNITRGDLARWLSQSARHPTVGASGGFSPDRAPASTSRVLELQGETFLPLVAPAPGPAQIR